MQSLIRTEELQGSHGVSASSGVASIYGKGARKHVQTRRLRIDFHAEGAQDYWVNVGVLRLSLAVFSSLDSVHKVFLR